MWSSRRLTHPAPAGMAGIGHCFWVAAILNATGEMAQPGVPVTVTIDYGDTGRGPTLPGTLDLWRWDEEADALDPGCHHLPRRPDQPAPDLPGQPLLHLCPAGRDTLSFLAVSPAIGHNFGINNGRTASKRPI